MNDIFMISLVLVMLSILMALIRVIRGPTAPDRIVGLDTINTLVIAGMIIFGVAEKEVIYIDVAIVYALLSYVTTLIVAKYLQGDRL